MCNSREHISTYYNNGLDNQNNLQYCDGSSRIMGLQENVLAVEKKIKMGAKSKMVVICARSNNKNKSYSTECKQIHDLCVYNMVLGYAQCCGQKILL